MRNSCPASPDGPEGFTGGCGAAGGGGGPIVGVANAMLLKAGGFCRCATTGGGAADAEELLAAMSSSSTSLKEQKFIIHLVQWPSDFHVPYCYTSVKIWQCHASNLTFIHVTFGCEQVLLHIHTDTTDDMILSHSLHIQWQKNIIQWYVHFLNLRPSTFCFEYMSCNNAKIAWILYDISSVYPPPTLNSMLTRHVSSDFFWRRRQTQNWNVMTNSQSVPDICIHQYSIRATGYLLLVLPND